MASIEKRGQYQYRARVAKAGAPRLSKTFNTPREADALADLRVMGVSEATMFPGLDGVCRMMKLAMLFNNEPIPPHGTPQIPSVAESVVGEAPGRE